MELIRLEVTKSTNDDAFRVLKRAEDCLLWTLNQTAGRGSRGRTWMAPAGHCLAVSIGFHIESTPHPREFCYPLFAGVLLFDCLAELTNPAGFSLKWPNDLLLHGRKLAGILCESRWQRQHACLVIGMGVNLMAHAALSELPKGFASLEELARPPAAQRLVEVLGNRFREALRNTARAGDLNERWLARSCHPVGTRLWVRAEGREIEGAVAGLDDRGGLSILADTGLVVSIGQSCEDFRILAGGPFG